MRKIYRMFFYIMAALCTLSAVAEIIAIIRDALSYTFAPFISGGVGFPTYIFAGVARGRAQEF